MVQHAIFGVRKCTCPWVVTRLVRCAQVQHIPQGQEGVSEAALREVLEAQARAPANLQLITHLDTRALVPTVLCKTSQDPEACLRRVCRHSSLPQHHCKGLKPLGFKGLVRVMNN